MTLRRRILLWIVALTAAALAVTGVTAVVALRAYLLDRMDNTLVTAAAALRERAVIAALAPVASGQNVQQVTNVSEFVAEFRNAQGGITRTTGTSRLPARPLLDQADLSRTGPQTVAGYRAVVVRDGPVLALVALPVSPVDDIVRRLILIAVVTSLAVLGVLCLAARLLLRRALSPLTEIAATATALADGDLNRRVPDRLAAPRTEVGMLTSAVNRMLARIQSALSAQERALAARERSESRMRAFVADASHELRTPVTSIRGYLQLVRTGVVDLRERPDVLGRLEDEATRMGTLVTSLLYLARLDAGPQSNRVPVDLAALIRDAAADARAVEPDRPLTVAAPASCLVTADPDGLRQVLANLLSNVRAHTPPGTAASVTLHPVDLRVEVTDAGPGFGDAATTHAFERFWRADASRPSSGGTGLGLAIVAEVIRGHGGTTGIEGSTVWFALPRDS
ncbi:sensory box histidine kinase PhoR [Winogradskya consettensis]|uniref:histidine kinase n=1 Tax=Winogradskya consettensis TaxID=113560 RepID=A0A919VPJ8_9ACTN|nr:HAMP domain-containing sensor histidine kinase [Actinoplanes consettensis]GIM73929.1 two-component sensor histidine kinase [Actinoplanes consettensis]